MLPMNDLTKTMAENVADAIALFQHERTGHRPKAVTVVLSGDTLVVTLHEALAPAEIVMATTAIGAAQIQEYHRQLFQSSIPALRQEIRRITGVAVREAALEVETETGAIIHAFTNGEMVQVFRMASNIPPTAWNSRRDTAPETP
jgi:uncharacterized protein YbcI